MSKTKVTLSEHQFHVVWTECLDRPGYEKRLFQNVLVDLIKKGLVKPTESETSPNMSKTTIPAEVLEKIKAMALEEKMSYCESGIESVPIVAGNSYYDGAHFGYQLATARIEELEGKIAELIEKAEKSENNVKNSIANLAAGQKDKDDHIQVLELTISRLMWLIKNTLHEPPKH